MKAISLSERETARKGGNRNDQVCNAPPNVERGGRPTTSLARSSGANFARETAERGSERGSISECINKTRVADATDGRDEGTDADVRTNLSIWCADLGRCGRGPSEGAGLE